ncbi:ABC transporter ATP-binding protein [Halolamina sediminis]|jgi:ABC-2 type transport system ATP-binding protein|uniref:ABC transporter ATP-binding protein n=1 Tax=Halolamina sediminis TaxID=1480675 RepID=UPI0006B536BF|nr:ABC transporter ATP-binding protein [Halolamina sediminis]
MAAIRTDGLRKEYGAVTAVDDLDLRVDAGEAFGFLGPNGAGKSTTIDLLLGFATPTAGRAELLGRDTTAAGSVLRRDVGVLPERYGVFEGLTAREHLRSICRLKGVDDDPDRLCDVVGLDAADRDRPAGGFSKGMRQRLALATAIAGDPDLLVLDEPSGGLDPTGITTLREIVRGAVDDGTAVFFSSHHLAQVEAVCDRVGIMNDGRLVAVDTVDGLRQRTGGAERLRLELDEAPGEPVLRRLRTVDGVFDVTVDGWEVVLGCREAPAKAEAVAAAVDAATVADFSVEGRSLERLFEQYTTDSDARAAADGALAAQDGGSP